MTIDAAMDSYPPGTSHSLASIGPFLHDADSRSMAHATAKPAVLVPASSRETIDWSHPSLLASSDWDTPSQSNQAEKRWCTEPRFMSTVMNEPMTTVKSIHDTLIPMSDAREARRYHALAKEVVAELGGGHGSKSAAARLLGVDQSLFSRIHDGTRKAGRDSIGEAIRRLRIDPDYFHGAAEPRSYKDYVRRRNRILEEFLSSPAAQGVSDSELAHLESIDFVDRKPSPMMYAAYLATFRKIASADVSTAVAAASQVDKEMSRLRKKSGKKSR